MNARVLAAMLILASSSANADDRANAIVQELGRFEPAIRAHCCPPPDRIDPEERRRELYSELLKLGPEGVEALALGLDDAAIGVRQNASLALSVLGGGWMLGEKLDISSALPNLIGALADSNRMVRSRSAHAIGSIGPGAATAVPALLELLERSDEGSRIGACIAFRGIGQPAAPALPALQRKLNDRSIDVREFAQRAIEAIEDKSTTSIQAHDAPGA